MSIWRRKRTFVDVDQLEHELVLLGPIHPGDVLVFRGSFDESMHEEMIEAVLDHYRRVFLATRPHDTDQAVAHTPLMVFLGPDQSVEALDEREMREHGWVRADV